jgi:hypothetical protein
MTPITEQHRKAAAEVAAELHWRFNLTTTSADVIAAILARWESQEIARLRSELNDLRAGLRSHLKRASRRTATSRP